MRLRVYQNLNRRCLSIQAKVNGVWRVVRYEEEITLKNVSFIISEAGHQRVLKTKRRAVHAWAEGEETEEHLEDGFPIRYNPYLHDNFINAETGETVVFTKLAYFNGKTKESRGQSCAIQPNLFSC